MNEYRLPPEWHQQDAIMLTWPHAQTDWAEVLEQVEPVYIEICSTIARFQKLVIVCHSCDLQQQVQQKLTDAGVHVAKISWVICATDDTWARDHGPITLTNDNGTIFALDFTFNGWGNKFEAENDNKINTAIFKQLNIKQQKSIPFVLEGGGIETDGQGTLLVTQACLLNPNRNPNFCKAQIEEKLADLFNIKQFLWLEHGELEGDDTDAHIDTLARFAPNNVLVYQGCNDPTDAHFASLNKMAQQLKQFTNSNNQAYQLFELPWPSAQFDKQGNRLPATYANFLIINNAVLLPVYGIEQDAQAIEVMQRAFPSHQVIAINCRAIIEQYGSLHCITMQLPKGFLANQP
ncbi:agmatine deiminase family protein [Catenovulum sediminis]|uniref:Agmatine deiminase family protein n=1 Tax=Catenovulum sediminis TaxID=1740262 RepID=A0ABV1RIU0_9ALTE